MMEDRIVEERTMEQDKTYGQSGLKVYFCGRENCAPGHFYGPTIRPHYLLHVILEGKGIYQYNGRTYHLKKGDAFLIPPMELTYYQADAVTPWSYAWVGFGGKICQEIFSQTVFFDSFVFENPELAHMEQISGYMEQLLESVSQSPGDFLKASGILLLLLSCMPRKNKERETDYATVYFQKAREYIEDNYAYPVKISDIAHYIGIDRTYLYRIFQEQVNLSPKQYLLQHRLRIATEMLCSTDYTVTEIALSCGFHDTSALCNYFREAVGETPAHFRKKMAAEKEAD